MQESTRYTCTGIATASLGVNFESSSSSAAAAAAGNVEHAGEDVASITNCNIVRLVSGVNGTRHQAN